MKNRISQNNIVEFTVNCILHMIILFTLLATFFFLYANNFGKKRYEKNMTKNYVPFVKNYIKSLSYIEKQSLLNFLSLNSQNIEILKEISNKESEKIRLNDKWLRTLCFVIVVLSVVFLALIIFIVMFIYKQKINIKEILIENFFTFFFAGLIESLFFYFIATKYTPINVSEFMNVFTTQLKKNLVMNK